jgi:hypothetical protein
VTKLSILLALLAVAVPAIAASKAQVTPMEVPQLDALPVPMTADVPKGTLPNEGAPGFHTDDDIIGVEIQPVAASEATTLDGEKASISSLMDATWLDSKKTADGWVLTYTGPGMDMEGKAYVSYKFDVHRSIGGKAYKCYGGLKKKEALAANVAICASLREKAKH